MASECAGVGGGKRTARTRPTRASERSEAGTRRACAGGGRSGASRGAARQEPRQHRGLDRAETGGAGGRRLRRAAIAAAVPILRNAPYTSRSRDVYGSGVTYNWHSRCAARVQPAGVEGWSGDGAAPCAPRRAGRGARGGARGRSEQAVAVSATTEGSGRQAAWAGLGRPPGPRASAAGRLRRRAAPLPVGSPGRPAAAVGRAGRGAAAAPCAVLPASSRPCLGRPRSLSTYPTSRCWVTRVTDVSPKMAQCGRVSAWPSLVERRVLVCYFQL
jgi:hypothetical protein